MPNVAALQSAAGPQQVARSAATGHHVSFREVLSALNPLQYLPVIGTIYRAVTGDQIPEALRRIGSFIASGLLGGPIGMAINLVITLAEKITGIDVDKTGQMLLTGNAPADHPIHDPAPAPAAPPVPIAAPASAPAPVARNAAAAPPAPSAPLAWSAAQLAAYGVSTSRDGVLELGDCRGADALNAVEMLRIQGARAAYGRSLNLAS